MGNRTPSRSFNTLKHSNRIKRKKKREAQQIILLSALVLVAAILLTLFVFMICSIVGVIRDHVPNETNTTNQGTSIRFTTSLHNSNGAVHSGDLIVVNEINRLAYTYPGVNLTGIGDIFEKQNGTNPYKYTFLQTDERMETNAARAANKMLTDFYLRWNDNSLILMDAYRTKEQQETRQTQVGYSEHETGLVFDLKTYQPGTSGYSAVKLVNNPNYLWILDNCAKYGIICRYPEQKSSITGISDYDYCFRYVGIPHATYIMQNGLCLEEYVAILKNYDYNAPLQINGADGNAYAVYYVNATSDELTEVPVPENYAYTFSGDNIGGFIVTVYLNQPIDA